VRSVLLRRRTLLFTLFVVVLAITFTLLSRWQWNRHEWRDAVNAQVQAALDAPPVPVTTLLPDADSLLPPDAQWRHVTATGRYDATRQILVRYRDLDSQNGFEVLTPLLTDAGVVWIDRGWIPSGAGSADPTPPRPAAGEVRIIGYLRASEPSTRAVRPETGQVRTITLPALERWYGRPSLDGYVSLLDEQPPSHAAPAVLPGPEISGGPHVSYAIQWALFALIAIGGYVKLVGDDVRAARGGPIASEALPTHISSDTTGGS